MARSKKEIFVETVDALFNKTDMKSFCIDDETYNAVMDYFNALKIVEEVEKKKFTDNGKIVLQYMKDNIESFNNMFKAKDFEGAGISSKTASGSLRKLHTDGYVEKVGTNPVIYMLTEKGKNVNLDEE